MVHGREWTVVLWARSVAPPPEADSPSRRLSFTAKVLGFGREDLEYAIWGFGFRLWDVGFMNAWFRGWGSEFGVNGLVFMVW